IALFAPTKQHIISTPPKPLQSRMTKRLKRLSMDGQKWTLKRKSFDKRVKRPLRALF
ncbi:unnamed protein product, partial [marine sediment metagenome]